MGFVYQERVVVIVDRSNRGDINKLLNELLVRLRKLCPEAVLNEFDGVPEREYTVLDLPWEG